MKSLNIELIKPSVVVQRKPMNKPSCIKDDYGYIINRPYNQAGMTLIEIMIALMLGVFLIGGLLQIFIGNKQSYHLAEAQSRLQENARYALETLSHDIRLTGYFGCNSNIANLTVIANNPLVAPKARTGVPAVVVDSTVRGGNNAVQNNAGPPPSAKFDSPSPPLSTSPLNGVIVGTDAVTIQFGESCGGYITGGIGMNTVDTAGNISLTHTCQRTATNNPTVIKGTPLVIADCSTAHIFRASNDGSQNTTGGAPTVNWVGKATPYLAGSEILLFRSYTYFIQPGASGQPALWRLDNNTGNSEELVEGVEDMQITYGLDTDAVLDGSANQYLDANVVTAAQWPNIVSVRVVLTMRSMEDNVRSVVNPARPYNGANLTDRRLVRTFTDTIELRNR